MDCMNTSLFPEYSNECLLSSVDKERKLYNVTLQHQTRLSVTEKKKKKAEV